jgi:hypothetical protein
MSVRRLLYGACSANPRTAGQACDPRPTRCPTARMVSWSGSISAVMAMMAGGTSCRHGAVGGQVGGPMGLRRPPPAFPTLNIRYAFIDPLDRVTRITDVIQNA